MYWVIVRDDGKYVTPAGQERSYTDNLQDALAFNSREAAEKNRCVENEVVMAIGDILKVK